MRSSFEGMEGMEGMQGMIGNAGNAGTNTGGGSGDWFFADRVDLPFVLTEQPEGIAISDQRIDIGEFPERNWSSIWYPGLVLAEFVLIKGWDAFNLLPPWADPTVASPVAHWSSNTVQTGQPKSAKAKVQDELDCLVLNARTERANAMAEIVSQKDEFASYFLNLLNATSSYPATARVLAIAGSIGGFTAMYYKGKYKKAAPDHAVSRANAAVPGPRSCVVPQRSLDPGPFDGALPRGRPDRQRAGHRDGDRFAGVGRSDRPQP